MVKTILDYRLAQDAKDQHNRDTSKMTPGQVMLWRELVASGDEDNG